MSILNDDEIVLDLGRPSLFEDEDFLKWGELHSWIKLHVDNIRVCQAFHFVDDCISTKQKYGGGGFKYEFVVENAETYCNFIKKSVEIWPETARGVLKYRNRNNETFKKLFKKTFEHNRNGQAGMGEPSRL